ncbi:MAG: hypothetical protein MRY59_01080 [Aquisalinus sp.]|nr:hypothetical protein [Aquisalinus sp.]
MKFSFSPIRLLSLLIMLCVMTGCVRLTMAWTDLTPDRPAASPHVLASYNEQETVVTSEDWDERAVLLRDAFQQHVYGVLPENSGARVINRRLVTSSLLDGQAQLEELTLEVWTSFDSDSENTATFNLLLATPVDVDGPVPLILMETFCPNHNTIPHPGVTRPQGGGGCDGEGIMADIMTYVFGRYIATPPLAEIVDRGFALATLYPSEFVPDQADAGLAALLRLSQGHTDDMTRWGSIAAWGWGFSRVLDVLVSEPSVDAERVVLYGHSRYGKAALFAAAYDERFAGVIAHQSGTGGAALNRHKQGESVGDITRAYPHWFSRQYATYAGREEALPVDQHQLLALIAPRPVLLGNARRDVWSDPEGTFVAAQGAHPVYDLLGDGGLQQTDLRSFIPDATLSFHLRPGTHGVTEEDWPAFFEFLEAHFSG